MAHCMDSKQEVLGRGKEYFFRFPVFFCCCEFRVGAMSVSLFPIIAVITLFAIIAVITLIQVVEVSIKRAIF